MNEKNVPVAKGNTESKKMSYNMKKKINLISFKLIFNLDKHEIILFKTLKFRRIHIEMKSILSYEVQELFLQSEHKASKLLLLVSSCFAYWLNIYLKFSFEICQMWILIMKQADNVDRVTATVKEIKTKTRPIEWKQTHFEANKWKKRTCYTSNDAKLCQFFLLFMGSLSCAFFDIQCFCYFSCLFLHNNSLTIKGEKNLNQKSNLK